MSRIGRTPITIPQGVTVEISDSTVTVTGTKGSLETQLLPGISVKIVDQEVVVGRSDDERQTRAYHGLIRSLIANNVVGVTDGYSKTLKLVGTGYRVASKGQGVSLSVGYSHPVEVVPPTGVTLKIEGNDTIIVSGIDKQLVGEVAANIRKTRPPEPYKGKGVRYEDEVVRRKQGKAAAG